MGTGLMALACLLLGPAAPAEDVVHFNQRGFTIPITIDPSQKSKVRELVLYLSKDQGRTWETAMRATPDKAGFDFMASGDGLHYFSIAVVDQAGRQDPADPYKSRVGQKIMIDTVKPAVKILSAERVGDKVQVSWEAREERPNYSTLRLEYKVGNATGGQWTPLPINPPGDRGNLSFRPGLPGELTLRLALKDQAENEGVDERIVADNSPRVDGALRTTAGSLPAPGPSLGSALPPLNSGAPMVGEISIPPAVKPVIGVPNVTPNATPTPHVTGHTPAPGGMTPPASAVMTSRAPLAEAQIVNKPQVKLGFDVSGFGPSGLGAVDVYCTTDEGSTWNPIKTDGPPQLPMPGEIRSGMPASGSVQVTLPQDGIIYGLTLIVKSRAGRSKPAPRAGEAPQVRVEYDRTAPKATLNMPAPDPTEADKMVFTWTADDRNIDNNPITLEWAANAGGPWTVIGEPRLPNSGRYAWKITSDIPPNVFLKLTVRDRAGNASVAKTDDAIPLDTKVPVLNNVHILPPR